MSTLEALHQQTGKVIIYFNRFLATVLLLGCAFLVTMIGVISLVKSPENYLKVQSFQINYLESKQASERKPTDPNWDGLLSGASVGYTYSRAIPVFGPITGALLGGVVGYQMDSKI